MKSPTLQSSLIAWAGALLLFSLLILAANVWTAPRIAAYERDVAEKKAQSQDLAHLLGPLFLEATGFEKTGSTGFYDSIADYYTAKNGDRTLGYAIHAFGKGYESVIHAIAAVNPDFSIRSVRMISEGETEGFGTRLWDEDFLAQFKGKTPERLRVITEEDPPDSNAIVALTAATISSRALAEDAVKTALLFLKKELGK